MGASDHDFIFWQTQSYNNSTGKRRTGFYTRNLKKVNRRAFAADLAMQPWECLENLSLDDMAINLNRLFLEVLDKHAPLKVIYTKEPRRPKPSEILKKLRRRRDNARGKGNLQRLRELRKKCKELTKKESVAFYKEKLENGGKNQFWKEINKIMGKNKQDEEDIVIENKTLSPSQASRRFNEFFINKINNLKATMRATNEDTFAGTKKRAENLGLSPNELTLKNLVVTDHSTEKIIRGLKSSSCPDVYGISPDALKLCPHVLATPLSFIINKAIDEGTFPNPWKSARVIPTHKHGKKSSVENYRPVSILPSFSKILETVLKNSLTSYLERNNILPDSQFGFRQGLSTQEALIALEHDIKRAKRDKLACGALFFDLSAAFDTIDRDILLEKLSIYGADDSFLSVIASFLTDRSQRVDYQGSKSDTISIATGSPQGSILSPILFLTMVSDIEEWVSLSSLYSYADDTTIMATAPTKEEVRRILTQDGEAVLLYMAAMRLAANPEKTDFIMFSRDPEESLRVGDIQVEESSETTLLGITFNKLLNWTSHFKKLESSLRQKTGLLKRLARKLPREVSIGLLQPLFISNILHSLPVLVDSELHNSPLVRNLHGLHRQAMKAVLSIPYSEHPSDAFLFEETGQKPISHLALSLLMSLACKCLPSWCSHPLTKHRLSGHPKTRCTRQNARYLPPQFTPSTLSFLVETFEEIPCHIRDETRPAPRKIKIRKLIREELG